MTERWPYSSSSMKNKKHDMQKKNAACKKKETLIQNTTTLYWVCKKKHNGKKKRTKKNVELCIRADIFDIYWSIYIDRYICRYTYGIISFDGPTGISAIYIYLAVSVLILFLKIVKRLFYRWTPTSEQEQLGGDWTRGCQMRRTVFFTEDLQRSGDRDA